MDEIAPGLFRWLAPHPAWRADSGDGWDELVGSVLYTTAADAVFIDPLLPRARARFWRWADARVRGRRVHVVTTIHWHRRDRDEVAARYAASVSRARERLPAGVTPLPLRGAGETFFWLSDPQALVPGDRLLGTDGRGLRLSPEAWLRTAGIDVAGMRALLAPVAELPVKRVLTSHGPPVLAGGQAALRRLLRTEHHQ